jgi:hypothetical protein
MEDPMQEFKFPQGKFSGWKRDNEILAGGMVRFFAPARQRLNSDQSHTSAIEFEDEETDSPQSQRT